jgi:hypothetical protein
MKSELRVFLNCEFLCPFTYLSKKKQQMSHHFTGHQWYPKCTAFTSYIIPPSCYWRVPGFVKGTIKQKHDLNGLVHQPLSVSSPPVPNSLLNFHSRRRVNHISKVTLNLRVLWGHFKVQEHEPEFTLPRFSVFFFLLIRWTKPLGNFCFPSENSTNFTIFKGKNSPNFQHHNFSIKKTLVGLPRKECKMYSTWSFYKISQED